jgi:hypothetical protein
MRIRLPAISGSVVFIFFFGIVGALVIVGYQNVPGGPIIYGSGGEYYAPPAGHAERLVRLVSVSKPQPNAPHSLILHIGGSEIETLYWTGLNVGAAAGVDIGVLITADVGAGAYNVFETFHVTADCPTMTITDSDFGNMIIQNIQHDGAGFEMILTADVPQVVIGSTRGFVELAGNLDEDFDKIELSGDALGGLIKTFHLEVKSRNACVIGRVKAGTFRFASGKVGEGDGLANKDLIIDSNVRFASGGTGPNNEVQTDVR